MCTKSCTLDGKPTQVVTMNVFEAQIDGLSRHHKVGIDEVYRLVMCARVCVCIGVSD